MLMVVIYTHNFFNKTKIFSVANKDKNRKMVFVVLFSRMLEKYEPIRDHEMMKEWLMGIAADDPIDDESLRKLLDDMNGGPKKKLSRKSAPGLSTSSVEMSQIYKDEKEV